MQPNRHVAMAASLLLAAVMVFSVGLGVVSAVGAAAGSSGKTLGTEHGVTPNAATVTASMHAGMQGKPVQYGSYNWAGYANNVSSAAFGTVYLATGEWYIPATSCPSSTPKLGTYLADWVGIDGFNTASVEQAGTFDYCSGAGATPEYLTWWEFYPYNDVQFVATNASAGDLVSTTITFNNNVCYSNSTATVCGVYTLSFEDFDAPWLDFQVVGNPTTCNSSGYCETGLDGSAECISEAPGIGGSYNGGFASVAKYTTTTFYGCADTIGSTFAGIGSHGTHAQTDALTQVGYTSGLNDQTVSGLKTQLYGLSEFTLYWHHYH
jgi:Peptidase A4 family